MSQLDTAERCSGVSWPRASTFGAAPPLAVHSLDHGGGVVRNAGHSSGAARGHGAILVSSCGRRESSRGLPSCGAGAWGHLGQLCLGPSKNGSRSDLFGRSVNFLGRILGGGATESGSCPGKDFCGRKGLGLTQWRSQNTLEWVLSPNTCLMMKPPPEVPADVDRFGRMRPCG